MENARFSPVYSEPVLGYYTNVEVGCLNRVSDSLDVSAFMVSDYSTPTTSTGATSSLSL
jgi:hypothetical protein